MKSFESKARAGLYEVQELVGVLEQVIVCVDYDELRESYRYQLREWDPCCLRLCEYRLEAEEQVND